MSTNHLHDEEPDTSIACPLCGDARTKVVENVSGAALSGQYLKLFGVARAVDEASLRYMSCSSCGLRFFDPPCPGDESLYERLQSFDWYYMRDKHEYEIAAEFLPPQGQVLEVGAGAAAFARKVGPERYVGLEFNSKAIERAAKAGVRLVKQTVEEHAAEGHRYEAVVSFQVLEHVPSPASFLRGCVRCLQPGGRLAIAVPALDGFLGTASNHVLNMPPHHVTHWPDETLRKIAQLFGLELRAIRHEPVAEYHRIWARKTVWENRLRSLAGITPRVLDVSFGARAVSKAASLLAARIPPSVDHLKGHTVVAVYELPS
jgi:SAM-dependent methyltransferase